MGCFPYMKSVKWNFQYVIFIFWAGTPVDRHCELMVTQEEPDLPTCVEEKHSLGESSMSSKEVLNTKDM